MRSSFDIHDFVLVRDDEGSISYQRRCKWLEDGQPVSSRDPLSGRRDSSIEKDD